MPNESLQGRFIRNKHDRIQHYQPLGYREKESHTDFQPYFNDDMRKTCESDLRCNGRRWTSLEPEVWSMTFCWLSVSPRLNPSNTDIQEIITRDPSIYIRNSYVYLNICNLSSHVISEVKWSHYIYTAENHKCTSKGFKMYSQEHPRTDGKKDFYNSLQYLFIHLYIHIYINLYIYICIHIYFFSFIFLLRNSFICTSQPAATMWILILNNNHHPISWNQ